MAAPDGTTARVYEQMSKDRSLTNGDLVAIIHGNTGHIPNRDTVKKARKRFLEGQALTSLPVSLPASKANGQPMPQPDPPPQAHGIISKVIRDVLAAVDVLGADGVLALVEICDAGNEKLS